MPSNWHALPLHLKYASVLKQAYSLAETKGSPSLLPAMAKNPSPFNRSATSVSPRKTGLFLILFGLVFTGAGFLAVYFGFVKPWLEIRSSQSWVETPCVILSSQLISNRSSDSTTYRVAMRFRYTWDGHEFESDRYDFTSGSTNLGVGKMREALRRHPVGLATVCFVNPANPASAVIHRGMHSGSWFGLVFLLLPVAGLAVLAFGVHQIRGGSPARKKAPSSAFPTNQTTLLFDATRAAWSERTDTPTSLRPAQGKGVALVGLLFITLFWNGIVSVFVYEIISSWQSGRGNWFLTLFMIPFVIIGLGMIAGVFAAASRFFAPPAELRLTPAACVLGGKTPLDWQIGTRAVKRLKLDLLISEEATYRQGTTTSTVKEAVHRQPLVDTTAPLNISAGRIEFLIPDTLPPSFHAPNNRLIWQLELRGQTPWWKPGLKEDYVLDVHAPASRARPPAAPTPEAKPITREFAGLHLWTLGWVPPGTPLLVQIKRLTGEASDALNLRFGWFTEGMGTTDAHLMHEENFHLSPGADRGFEINLPPNAPTSFQGSLVSVLWQLEVIDAKGLPLGSVPMVVGPHPVAPTLTGLPDEEQEGSALVRWGRRRAKDAVWQQRQR